MCEVNMIWIGEYNESVQKCIDSFARHHKVNLWGYSDLMYKNCEYRDISYFFDVDYSIFPNIPSLTSFLRLKIIYDFGGWYSDTDNYCIKPLEFDYKNIVTRFWPSGDDLNNSIFCFEKHSKHLKNLIDSYHKVFYPSYLFFSQMLQNKEGIEYLPPNILHLRYNQLGEINEDTRVVHLFNSHDSDRNSKLIEQIDGCTRY